MGLRWRKDAQAVLCETETEPALLAVLLTNLETAADGTVRPRLPFGMLGASIGHVCALPFAPGKHTWEGPTQFVKRAQSKCVGLAIRGEREVRADARAG
jgi:hypothetical protein